MANTLDIQSTIGTVETENKTATLLLARPTINESNGEICIDLRLLYEGDIWVLSFIKESVLREVIEEDHPFTSIFFRGCVSRDRKALRSATESTLREAVREYVNETHRSEFIEHTERFITQARTLFGDDSDQKIAEARAEVRRAQEDAQAAKDNVNINSLILNAVSEAIAPEIKQKIQDELGAFCGVIPTKLEVKMADRVIVTEREIRHPKFEDVLTCVVAGVPVWLVGEAGTGKSIMCEQIAEAIDAKFFCVGTILDEYAGLKGFIDANGVKHGTAFTEALELATRGQEVVLCLDECDGSTPEVLLVLNNLLSGGFVECMGDVYKMPETLHVIACGNTNGRGGTTAYTRSILDSATLDRFMMLEVDYDPAIELISANGDEDLQQFARVMRESAKECEIDLLLTYRAINRLARFAPTLGYKTALQGGALRGLDSADCETLAAHMRDKLSGNRWMAEFEKLVN